MRYETNRRDGSVVVVGIGEGRGGEGRGGGGVKRERRAVSKVW